MRAKSATHLYASLLVLYPRSYRENFGPDMVQLFADRYRDERPAGDVFRFVRFWGGMICDIFKTALTERTESVMSNFKRNWWKWMIGAGAILQLVFLVEGVVAVFDSSNEHTTAALMTVLVTGTTSGAILVGLRIFNSKARPATYLLTYGLLPLVFAGAVFYWFPPTWLVSVLGVYLIVKVCSETGRLTRTTGATA